MLQIFCPHCGLRDESEFYFGGESAPPRPARPEELDDAAWAAFLFERENRKGQQIENWQHRYGCHQWFQIQRNTVSHMVSAVEANKRKETGA